MGNGNTGLKSQFGVGDPNNPGQNTPNTQDAGSDKQAQDFQAAFQKEQGVINGYLQYTAANAEASQHDPLAARRDAMFTAFQSALAKIDRKDPSKAQGAIDNVLGDVRALSGEVAAFRQQAEKAKTDWDARQSKYDDAVRQIEELEAWEDAKAPALRGLVDGIRKQVNDRQYAQATNTLDQLLPKLAPIYEEYLRQKEAKPQYEQQLAEQSARLEPLKAADRPSQPMTAKASEADAALQEAKGKADAKDFVAGVGQMQTVRAAVDELDKMANDPERAKFLADSQAAEQTSEPQPEPAFKTLEADWSAISAAGAQAQPLADSGDYAAANQALADSKAKRAEFQRKHDELVQQKQSYEDTLSQVQPRLQAASVSEAQYATLQPMQQELATAQTQMESAAQAEDFGQALTQVQDLSAKLDAFEKGKAEIDQKKQEYEAALGALQPRLQAASTSEAAYAKLQPMQQELASAQTEMEGAAQAGDYDKANQSLQDLGAKLDAFEKARGEIDQKKQEYEAALAALQPRLQASSSSEAQYAKLQPLQQAVAQVQSDMEAAAQAGDYDKANQCLKDLGAKLDAFEKAKAEIDRKKQEYETLRATAEPRIAEASKKQYLNLAPKLEEIKKLQGQAAAAAQSGDYDQATTHMKDAFAKTDAYVAACDKEVEPPIMGETQDARAAAVMKKLPEADQKEVKTLMDSAKSEAEKQYLLKGVAAGHTVAELKTFAKKVEGKDEKWMRDNLSVTGSSTGSGVKQQWGMSCNATAAQAVKAQMDPLYALKLHEENPKLDQADNADGTKMNPKLAAEQKAGLEADYKGSVAGGSKGVAVSRDAGGDGRWADDLLNNQSDTTGVSYATQKDPPIADAMKTIDSGVGKGQPVPIVIGSGAGKYTHYVVVTGMTKGPPKQYTIHDPWDGTTVVRTEAQMSGGALNLTLGNQITAIENPSAKEVK
jgi:hypothetical protein